MFFSRERSIRICLALAAPDPLAAFCIVITRSTSDSLLDAALGFPIFVLTAYAFAILPSMLYAFLMEVWFEKNLHSRIGLLATVAFSAVLGATAGFAIQTVALQESGFTYFVSVGGIVGLIIGFFLFRVSLYRKI